MQGSRWKRLVVGKRSEPGEMREPVAWGGEEEEGRKKDGEQGEWIHPSVTLWQTARESQCEASPLSSSRLSARPSVRPPVRPSLSLSPHVRPPSLSACPSDRLFVCLLSLSSPASPDASLASGIHLLSCPVPCPPPPLLLLFPPSSSLPPPSHHRSYTRHPSFSFSISLDFFKILSSGSLERDRNRDREEGWILESSAHHNAQRALFAFRHVEDEDDILDGVPGVWRREGSEKGKGKGMLEAGGARRASVVRPGSPSR